MTADGQLIEPVRLSSRSSANRGICTSRGLSCQSGTEPRYDPRLDPFLVDNGKEAIFDAEHFFDGYKRNREYALARSRRLSRARFNAFLV